MIYAIAFKINRGVYSLVSLKGFEVYSTAEKAAQEFEHYFQHKDRQKVYQQLKDFDPVIVSLGKDELLALTLLVAYRKGLQTYAVPDLRLKTPGLLLTQMQDEFLTRNACESLLQKMGYSHPFSSNLN